MPPRLIRLVSDPSLLNARPAAAPIVTVTIVSIRVDTNHLRDDKFPALPALPQFTDGNQPPFGKMKQTFATCHHAGESVLGKFRVHAAVGGAEAAGDSAHAQKVGSVLRSSEH